MVSVSPFGLAYSPHFVLVLDHKFLKIKTDKGPPRTATKHELLHLMLQRAEQARLDFEKVFGPAYNGRSAMVMVRSDSVRRAFSQVAGWSSACPAASPPTRP